VVLEGLREHRIRHQETPLSFAYKASRFTPNVDNTGDSRTKDSFGELDDVTTAARTFGASLNGDNLSQRVQTSTPLLVVGIHCHSLRMHPNNRFPAILRHP
jgi:hypothetical protein